MTSDKNNSQTIQIDRAAKKPHGMNKSEQYIIDAKFSIIKICDSLMGGVIPSGDFNHKDSLGSTGSFSLSFTDLKTFSAFKRSHCEVKRRQNNSAGTTMDNGNRRN
jgi:hypothetical protein